jgi:DNA-binding FrmR family transcriptional regulator
VEETKNAAAVKRKRAVAGTEGQVGRLRNELYRSAIDRANDATTKGYYLEAIMLVESLIGDRLESYLNHYNGLDDNSFKPLERLIKRMKEVEKDFRLSDVVLEELAAWKGARNRAAHEMVKIEAGASLTWQQRNQMAQKAAEEGIQLFGVIIRQLRKLHPRGARTETRSVSSSKDISSSAASPT